MIRIQDVIAELENIAPPIYQEGYDNAGLIVGDASAEVKGIITCLDSTESVIQEAIDRGCNLVVAHHPIIFRGLKQLTGQNYIERTVIKAIKNDVAIYAIHTNLDNVLHRGVNQRIGQRLGLTHMRILAPKQVLQAARFSLPGPQVEAMTQKLQAIGAQVIPTATSHNKESLQPMAVTFAIDRRSDVLRSLNLPENEVQVYDLNSRHPEIGSGLIGNLPEPLPESAFFDMLKDRMQVSCIRHTALRQKDISRVALCGGAGGFLLPAAMKAGAQIFITADYKYHEFFDADGRIIIADIGHFESEQFTIHVLQEVLSEKFTNFATYSTAVVTNPVHYR